MNDWVTTATGLLRDHPAVTSIEFAGSRSRGTNAELSDWDFAVETSDFAALARDLPALVEPLHPLSRQWEPMGHFPVYQVLLPGLTKIEYLFLGLTQEPLPARAPTPETLAAVDTHFWDWIWWITTKAALGLDNVVADHLSQLHAHLLGPMGVEEVPPTIDAAVRAFVTRRDALEREYGVSVDRALEDEVRRGIHRVLGGR
ncbi:hypothetical protein [Intrasporangium flavum]|uniref:hypothetical protein n=1 Tax=Intrasporangium flavum TaxID=1428657 RepID=UPI00096EB55C|nr:hypothetical protein [Intrasporangium flavum]